MDQTGDIVHVEINAPSCVNTAERPVRRYIHCRVELVVRGVVGVRERGTSAGGWRAKGEILAVSIEGVRV